MDIHMICANCYSKLIRQLLSRRCFSARSAHGAIERNFNAKGESLEGKSLKVAIIGPPNVGKSALTNALIRANVCAVSRQIDTTRYNTTTALTEDDCQLVIVDSPGLIGTKHAKKMVGTHADARILVDPEAAIKHAGHALVVQDVSAPGQYIHHRVLHLLHRYAHIPATLVLNKVDLLPRRSELLNLTNVLTEGLVNGETIQQKFASFGRLGVIAPKSERKNAEESFALHHTASITNRDEKWHTLYNNLLQKPTHKCAWSDTRRLYMGQNGWPNFKAVFYVSCLSGEGVDDLRDHLKELSQPTVWRFDKETVSKKNPQKICLEHIRSKFLNLLPAYMAYALKLHLCEWEVDEFSEENGQKTLKAIVDVKCEKERSARLALRVAPRVEMETTTQLSSLFHTPVLLRLRIKHNGRFFIDNAPLQEQKEPEKENVKQA